jgi:hypothetical protein
MVRDMIVDRYLKMDARKGGKEGRMVGRKVS